MVTNLRRALTGILVFVLTGPLFAQTTMLDTEFGNNGTSLALVGPGVDNGYSIALQPDGKIVEAGYSNDIASSGGNEFAVVRFDSNGTIDSTFGTDGIASTFIRGGDSADDEAFSVALQPDGKIVLAGYSADTVGGLRHVGFALARFNPNGTPDNTFGTGGTVRAFINGGNSLDAGRSVVIQSDGKIVVVGSSIFTYTFYGFSAARFDPDGTLDKTFGTNGTILFSINGGDAVIDEAYAAALQPDGKIVLAGYSIDANGIYGFALARLDSDGVLDNTFGNGGCSRYSVAGGGLDDRAFAMAVQPDGKIVAAGFSLDSSSKHYGFGVARFDAGGTPDNSFGTDGSTRTYVHGGDSTYDWVNAVALQTDGKIVLAGFSAANLSDFAFAVARMDSDGSLDNSFGTDGTSRNYISDGDIGDEAHSVVIQPDGKIVVGGETSGGAGGSGFAVARYLSSNVTGIREIKSVPKNFGLSQNYPNPFNPTTVISYQLSAISNVTLKVYDILGRVVTTLVNERQSAGRYSVTFDGSRLASGIYFYRLAAGSYVSVKKLVLLK